MANPSTFKATSTDWKLIYRGTGDTSDGLVESPYYLANFDDDRYWWPAGMANLTGDETPYTIDDDAPQRLGTERLFLQEGADLQLLPLFSVDAATALIQLWGFDVTDRGFQGRESVDVESLEPRYIIDPNSRKKTSKALGEAHNLARNDPGQPRTIPLAALDELMTIKASLVHGDRLPRDQNGETFAVGARHTFDTEGFGAFMVNVPVLSSGELLLFARFRTPGV